MTLGELLLQYRKENNLTQRDLASRLGVSDMTISRIESGSRFRPSQPFAAALFSLFPAEELLALSDCSSLGLKELVVATQKPVDLNEQNMYLALKEQCLYSGLALRMTPSLTPSFYDLEILLPNNKLWLVDLLHVSTSPYSPSNTRKEKYLDLIYSHLGKCCCCPEIFHKYSIMTNIPFAQLNFPEQFSRLQYPLQKLGHDVSLIHFNPTTNRIDYEQNLAFFTDGRGLFDLDVTENQAVANSHYAQWMRAINDIIPSSAPTDAGSIDNAN